MQRCPNGSRREGKKCVKKNLLKGGFLFFNSAPQLTAEEIEKNDQFKMEINKANYAPLSMYQCIPFTDNGGGYHDLFDEYKSLRDLFYYFYNKGDYQKAQELYKISDQGGATQKFVTCLGQVRGGREFYDRNQFQQYRLFDVSNLM
jgi:hypothetical protein